MACLDAGPHGLPGLRSTWLSLLRGRLQGVCRVGRQQHDIQRGGCSRFWIDHGSAGQRCWQQVTWQNMFLPSLEIRGSGFASCQLRSMNWRDGKMRERERVKSNKQTFETQLWLHWSSPANWHAFVMRHCFFYVPAIKLNYYI